MFHGSFLPNFDRYNLMRGRRGDLHAGQFIREQVNLVNQDREALRADMFSFAFEGQMHERNLLVCLAAIRAF